MLVGQINRRGRALPEQNAERIMVLAERWQRACDAHSRWAETAKNCVDFVEGRQWTKEQLAKMAAMGRPAMTFNKTGTLVRLVLGYFQNNRTDAKYLPGNDTLGTEAVAEVLTQTAKQISEASELPFVDTEVFMDGITTGRGFFDQRVSYDDNDFGEVKITSSDAFRTYLDPDGEEYDVNKCNYIIDVPSLSIDEIEWMYGKPAAEMVRPFTMGKTPLSPISMMPVGGEITPVRAFGSRDDDMAGWFDNLYGLLGDFADPYRKTIRVMDFQYWVTTLGLVFIDLETGDRGVIPQSWTDDQINKVLYAANQAGNPLIVDERPIKRIRWTTMAGDVMLYDGWSKYDHFTKIGYFPYFRRGTTKGMVEDLIDPQREINKRRSASIENAARSGNVGWLIKNGSMEPKDEAYLRKYGAMPGVVVKWGGKDDSAKPERLQPAAPAIQHEREAEKAKEDLREISGVNDSALGEQDNVTSGKAIIARQKQAIIAIQLYMTNFQRSRKLLARNQLDLVQKTYKEQRMFRIIGEDGKLAQVMINQAVINPDTGMEQIINNITLGKYQIVVDERPLSATFENGQFEEMVMLIEKLGEALPLQIFGDLILEHSTLPNKEEWVRRYKLFMGMEGAEGDPALAGGQAGGGPGGQPQGLLPPPSGTPQAGGPSQQVQLAG